MSTLSESAEFSMEKYLTTHICDVVTFSGSRSNSVSKLTESSFSMNCVAYSSISLTACTMSFPSCGQNRDAERREESNSVSARYSYHSISDFTSTSNLVFISTSPSLLTIMDSVSSFSLLPSSSHTAAIAVKTRKKNNTLNSMIWAFCFEQSRSSKLLGCVGRSLFILFSQ